MYLSFIATKRIEWVGAITATDSVLRDAVVHIEENGVPTSDLVAGPHDRYILLGPDHLSAQFDIPNYRINGPSVATASSFTYVPVDPGVGHIAKCKQSKDRRRMHLCVVYATYPPDENNKLKARLCWPPDPADAPTCFRDVVRRMRKVANCLDVTEDLVDVPEAHPTLTGCRPEPIS